MKSADRTYTAWELERHRAHNQVLESLRLSTARVKKYFDEVEQKRTEWKPRERRHV
jgi:hypothetical protein